MVLTIFWLPTSAEKRQNFQKGGGGGNAKKYLGATDQPLYNGFRVILIRLLRTLQCITYNALLVLSVPDQAWYRKLQIACYNLQLKRFESS